MISYSVKQGKLIIEIDGGYAGKGEFKNKPEFENLPNLGPIPRGKYKVQPPRRSTTTGPYVLDLTPLQEQDRQGFQIHGDSINDPGNASTGCIIEPRRVRELIWEICERLGDHTLNVID